MSESDATLPTITQQTSSESSVKQKQVVENNKSVGANKTGLDPNNKSVALKSNNNPAPKNTSFAPLAPLVPSAPEPLDSREVTPEPPSLAQYQTDNEISESEADLDNMAASNQNHDITGDSHPASALFDDSISEVYEAVENYTFGINDDGERDGEEDGGDDDSITTASMSSRSAGSIPRKTKMNGTSNGRNGSARNGRNGSLGGSSNGSGGGELLKAQTPQGNNGHAPSSHSPRSPPHDDEDEYHSTADTESTCSMEECVARIESTLRRQFRKMKSNNGASVNANNNNNNAVATIQQKLKGKPVMKERVEDEELKDVTQLPGYQPVPENCPQWKKAMIEKKNAQLLEDAKKELLQKKAEEEKWRDVPAWKKNLILEKEKKNKDSEAPTEQEKARMEEERKRLEAMPEWKRKLVMQKRGDN